MQSRPQVAYPIGGVSLVILVAIWSPFIDGINPILLTLVSVAAIVGALYGVWAFVTNLRNKGLATDDLALLGEYVEAEEDGRDLNFAHSEYLQERGWTLQDYGRVVQRLVDDGLIEAQIQPAGDGIGVVIVRRVTAEGRRTASGI